MSLSQTERQRVIKDIINHAIEEEEVGAGGEFTADDVADLRNELENCSDDELQDWWFSAVGEWIASMQRWGDDEYHNNADGMGDWAARGYDNVVEWQYNKLVDEGKTDYGYIYPEYTQPY